MIRKLYVHNFRCLEGFELSLAEHPTALLIGRNGSGKSTVGDVLEKLQQIARGNNRIGELFLADDFALGRQDLPMRFALDVELSGARYHYELALELPERFHELRVLEETLSCGGQEVYTRERAQIHLFRGNAAHEAQFLLDWHLVALPVVQEQAETDPLAIFRKWLSQLLVIAPIPQRIGGESDGDTLLPDRHVAQFSRWFTGLLTHSPSAYQEISETLREWMPDLKEIKNLPVGRNAREIRVQFQREGKSIELPFAALSDGEKCFFICALVIAANRACGPLFCFWDEPDNYLAPDEVGHFVLRLRRALQSGGQFLATSHNPEAIRRFADENTLWLYRDSHLEPTRVKRLDEIEIHGDLVDALIRGDVEP